MSRYILNSTTFTKLDDPPGIVENISGYRVEILILRQLKNHLVNGRFCLIEQAGNVVDSCIIWFAEVVPGIAFCVHLAVKEDQTVDRVDVGIVLMFRNGRK